MLKHQVRQLYGADRGLVEDQLQLRQLRKVDAAERLQRNSHGIERGFLGAAVGVGITRRIEQGEAEVAGGQSGA